MNLEIWFLETFIIFYVIRKSRECTSLLSATFSKYDDSFQQFLNIISLVFSKYFWEKACFNKKLKYVDI